MKCETNDDVLISVLDAVEQSEARLLSWGVVDGYLSDGELNSIIDKILDGESVGPNVTFFDAQKVVDELLARALIVRIGSDDQRQYRSRMAEGVRLLFRLRQMFAKHRGPVEWQSAPTLVSDFRFIWRRRRYPRRDIDRRTAIERVSLGVTDLNLKSAISALFGSFSDNFRLASFQLDAASRIFSGFETDYSIGTLVSAGTGSGKTFAFYLPSLARIASHILGATTPENWVKALALYPRTELLKDQFSEVYSQARRLDGLLLSKRRRKILVGAFFGPTPRSAEKADGSQPGWKKAPNGVICEYIRCPIEGCTGEMQWPDDARAMGLEKLVCTHCSAIISDDEIVITRDRLQLVPPDVLFSTTEMMNQRMGDDYFKHLFGIGSKAVHPVESMLLDEVHTYQGRSGAQVAYLLRRWRKAVRKSVNFVGLSATIRDGEKFFAQLLGLGEQAVSELAPRNVDMMSEGAEYLLALRGDPVSRSALLSTTIQTTMLLSRILDEPSSRKSIGVFGERTFLFTDDIDVTNRMYFSVLDAEGRRDSGDPDLVRYPDGGLASLRRPLPVSLRKLDGQDWEAVVTIGHSLQPQDRKTVGRVMSMDPGLGSGLDVVVATASLEVGYNDPSVGAVIQHKAPREVSQFLQRKGRAGRNRKMRPWTVVVLSDFGRDRIAYQNYDLLFDPELPPRSLPIGNRYILRMQAVYASLDYLSSQLRGLPRGSVWTNLASPASTGPQIQRQSALAGLISEILSNSTELERYSAYLASALRIDEETLKAILWDHPRALLTHVLPTALRRLQTSWSYFGNDGEDFQVPNNPLPEFVPQTLFSDLSLPEVKIAVPGVRGSELESPHMPISQALREFAPGRVSRRYGLNSSTERHWIAPLPDRELCQTVEIERVAESEELGFWKISVDDKIEDVPVRRPRQFNVVLPPYSILDTSNARLRWRSQLVLRRNGVTIGPPRGTKWEPLVEDIRFCTHATQSAVEARRFALESDADIRFRDGSSVQKKYLFQFERQRTALGFSIEVDALCLRIRMPKSIWTDIGTGDPLSRSIRTAKFQHDVVYGSRLASVPNGFTRGWLAQLVLAAVSNEAIARRISVREAIENVRSDRAEMGLVQTLDVLFQSPIIDDASAQGNLQDKLRQELSEHIADTEVLDALYSSATSLWSDIDDTWEIWLRERFLSTIGSACLHSIASLCPEVDMENLVLDISAGPREEDDVLRESYGSEIWISETSPGGNGQIEEIQRQYVEDPRRFFNLLTSTLRDIELTQNDTQLIQILQRVVTAPPDDPIVMGVDEFRRASCIEGMVSALADLRRLLVREGYVTSHSFIVALTNRILRSGSSHETDVFIANALKIWEEEEQRLGIELDARTVAYRLARTNELDAILTRAGIDVPTVNPEHWRLGLIYGLFWPRGHLARVAGLNSYSPFGQFPTPEPLLVNRYLAENGEFIDLEEPEWQSKCFDRLATDGFATLTCQAGAMAKIAEALNILATTPVQSNYLSVYSRVQAIRRVDKLIHLQIDVVEALQ